MSAEKTRLERSSTAQMPGDAKLEAIRDFQRQVRPEGSDCVGSQPEGDQGPLPHCLQEEQSRTIRVPADVAFPHALLRLDEQGRVSAGDSGYNFNRVTSRVEAERIAGHKRLLDALDHVLLTWSEEISLNFAEVTHRHMELYFQQVILSALNKAWYYKRIDYVVVAIEVLEPITPLCDQLKSSKNPDTLYLCGRFALTQGALHMDRAPVTTTLKIDRLIEGLDILLSEQKIRLRGMNFIVAEKLRPKYAYRLHRNVSPAELPSRVDNRNHCCALQRRSFLRLDWEQQRGAGQLPVVQVVQRHRARNLRIVSAAAERVHLEHGARRNQVAGGVAKN